MNKRSDYDFEKVKKIYDEYISTNTSYNKLSKKYGISPQRVAFLIKDYKNSGLATKLNTNSTKADREKHKNLAVDLREQGKISVSVDMLDEVIAWDEANNNLRGKADVLGHKKIALLKLSETSNNEKLKKKYYDLALDCIKEGIKITEKSDFENEGSKFTQYVHYASLLENSVLLFRNIDKQKTLSEALKYVDMALKNGFTGSDAHKAWPLGIKARILHAMGKTDEAVEVLQHAQKMLYTGYEEEVKIADQAELKLRVWNSSICLGLGKIYLDTNKPILAEVYLSAVVNTPDPDGILVARKKEAKELLKKVLQ